MQNPASLQVGHWRSSDHKAWPVPVWTTVYHECCTQAEAEFLRAADLRRRVERTVEYAEQLLALDDLASDLRVVLAAVRNSLRSPAGKSASSGSGELHG